MDIVTREEVRNLTTLREKNSVSIFMPTHHAGAEVRQNAIRLKNLLREAEEKLAARGIRTAEIEQLLKKPKELLIDQPFWQDQRDGFALFVSPSLFLYYRLPLQLQEMVVVADRFHIKPLFSLFTGNGKFFLLALSLNEVRAFQGTHYSIGQIELKGIPKSLDESMQFVEQQKQLQFHTETGGNPQSGKRGAMFHGHGAGSDVEKEYIMEYLHQIDKGLQPMFVGETAPLLPAGVEYLLSYYRKVNTYPNVLEQGVAGNPELLSARELHGRAWEIIEPYFRRQIDAAIGRYHQLKGTGRASDDLQEILFAAHTGRIDTLILKAGIQKWGNYHPEENRLELRSQEQNGAMDLLNSAAMEVFLKSGAVYRVYPSEQSPDFLAIFRY